MVSKDPTTPIFCVETKEKTSGKKFFINFKTSKNVEYPPVDYDSARLLKEMTSRGIENVTEYKIPLMSSPIYWSKKAGETDERHYVIMICINDRFAIRRVLKEKFMQNYLVEVAMLVIEEKYNSATASVKTCGQFIGHKIDLDSKKYTLLEKKLAVDVSGEIVNNKVTLVDSLSGDSRVTSDDKNLDFAYRPGSKLLTVSILIDKCPDSIGFNDDRIVVKEGEKTICDSYLPFFIDLKEPVKYRFFDTMGAFRMVFKIKESL